MDSEDTTTPIATTSLPAGFDELLTVSQAATALGAGRTKMFRMLKNKTIPSLKIEGSRRIKRSEVQSYLNRLADDEQAA